jgi:hypothetical protein
MPQSIPEIDQLEASLAAMSPIRSAIVRLLDAIADFIRHSGGISPENRARLQALVTNFNAESTQLNDATQRNLDVDPGNTGATGP